MIVNLILGRPQRAAYLAHLAACERAAGSSVQGRQAFVTWFIGRLAGWQTARHMVTRNSWYLHLQILRAAGIQVPERFRYRGVPEQPAQDPTQLVGRHFVVQRTWEQDAGPEDRQVPHVRNGMTGTVDRLIFSRGGLAVGVIMADGVLDYQELPLREFLAAVELAPRAAAAA